MPSSAARHNRHMEDDYPQPVYFIGIALPAELDRTISQLQWQIHERNKHTLKPLLPHVTLLHPPSLQGIMPEELLPRIHEIAQRYVPLTLAIQDIGFFGKNVCYLSVQSHALHSLQSQLIKLLPPEAQALHYKQPYLPHITVAQSYEPSMLDVNELQSTIPNVIKFPQQFTVGSISCFQRILPRQYRADKV